jgi:uncharacterized pyridoxal phosphate-containing UPF0001 family protein
LNFSAFTLVNQLEARTRCGQAARGVERQKSGSVVSPSLETPRELTLEFLTSKQTEKLNVVRDQHAAITTVVADQRIKKIPVERAESIGASHNCSVDDWVVVRVRGHYTRSGAGENNF